MAVGSVQRGHARLNLMALLMSLLMLAACKNDSLFGGRFPPNGDWSLDVFSPPFMQGWVEQVIVEDVNGRMFIGPGGVVGSGDPDFDKEEPRGWGSIGRNIYVMTRSGLPKRIYVRWQSITEQKTYQGWVDIPEDARRMMRGSVAHKCPGWPDNPMNHMAAAIIGVAPGGKIGVWVEDNCLNDHLIASAQAEIEPLGPDQGMNHGRYAYPIKESTKRYIERYGIPYGSW